MAARFLRVAAKTLVMKPLKKAVAALRRRSFPRYRVPQSDCREVLGCCIAYTESGGFCVPLASRHRPAVQRVLQGHVYERSTIEFLTKHCGDGDIVHAGTYFGDFLPALSRACGLGAKVWAFEPNRESFRCASITCAINGLPNVELRNAALGAQSGTMSMLVKGRDGLALGGASRLTDEEVEDQELVEVVEIVTLDQAVPAHRTIAIVQLDVEGYEERALYGGLATIRRCLPILVLETLPSRAWLEANLLGLGYRSGPGIHRNAVLLPPLRKPLVAEAGAHAVYATADRCRPMAGK